MCGTHPTHPPPKCFSPSNTWNFRWFLPLWNIYHDIPKWHSSILWFFHIFEFLLKYICFAILTQASNPHNKTGLLTSSCLDRRRPCHLINFPGQCFYTARVLYWLWVSSCQICWYDNIKKKKASYYIHGKTVQINVTKNMGWSLMMSNFFLKALLSMNETTLTIRSASDQLTCPTQRFW